MSPPPVRHGPRFPALDAVRAVAMLFGVALHALIPYMEQPVPHLLWPVREPGGLAFDAVYWWIHGFRVQLFFLISGVLAAASLAKVGPSLREATVELVRACLC
jgi:peptidoglycan/LPS O-acetylase OafA/YrhL